MSPESHFPRQHDTNTSAPYCNSRGKHMKYDVVATATVVVGISLLPGAQSHLALAMQFLQTLFMVQPLHTKKMFGTLPLKTSLLWAEFHHIIYLQQSNRNHPPCVKTSKILPESQLLSATMLHLLLQDQNCYGEQHWCWDFNVIVISQWNEDSTNVHSHNTPICESSPAGFSQTWIEWVFWNWN